MQNFLFYQILCRVNFALQNCILLTLNMGVLVTSMIDFRRFISFYDSVGYQWIEHYYIKTYRTYMKYYQKLRYISLYHRVNVPKTNGHFIGPHCDCTISIIFYHKRISFVSWERKQYSAYTRITRLFVAIKIVK